jgi:hypothetical protein
MNNKCTPIALVLLLVGLWPSLILAEARTPKGEREAVASSRPPASTKTFKTFTLSFTCTPQGFAVSARGPEASKALERRKGEVGGLLKALRIQCPAKIELQSDPSEVLLSY